MHSAEVVSATADGPRTWVFGGRGEAERFDQRLVRSESLSGGVLTREMSEVAPRALAKIAAYGQLQWKLGSLTLLPGARVEAHSQYGEDVAPRFAAAWRPVDELTLRASVGGGFRSLSGRTHNCSRPGT